MKKFEYKVLTFGYGMIPDEQRLNELGQSGWELPGKIVDSEKKISNFFFKKEVAQKPDKMLIGGFSFIVNCCALGFICVSVSRWIWRV